MSNYYADQIKEILENMSNSEYPAQIQIKHDGKSTKWLNITPEALEALAKLYE